MNGAFSMTQEEVIEVLSVHKQELSTLFGVTKIGLAGSYARGITVLMAASLDVTEPNNL